MESALLLNTLVNAVAKMRELQRWLSPGSPLALRREAQKWEQEVDSLIALHQLPPLLEVRQLKEGGGS